MYAIGGNIEAARVNIVKNILIISLISGFLYGLAGYHGSCTKVGSNNTGLSYDLDAISASVIRGVSLLWWDWDKFIGAIILNSSTWQPCRC